MTRKQALHKALEVLTDEEAKSKIREILNDMPFIGWSERTIFDTIDQFVIDNGRPPSLSDFKKKGLPPHTVIKLRFGISLKEFLEKYYPPIKLCTSRIYYEKTKEQWKEIFMQDYIKNRPTSAEKHNKMRATGTPSWQTISVMFGINKWSDWIVFCGLKTCFRVDRKMPIQKSRLTITTHSDLLMPV